MDLKEVAMPALRGMSIGFFDPMNGGKTEALVAELRRGQYYNYNVVAFNSSLNTREVNAVVVDGREPFPAKTVSSVAEIHAEVERLKNYHRIYTPSISRLGQPMDAGGVPQRTGYPLQVVGIDEANLFTLMPQGAQEMIDFLSWSREQQLVVYLSGLMYDFRHLPFGQVHSVLPYIDIKISKKPACMALLDEKGTHCQNTAMHTQRVWSREFAIQTGLEKYLASEPFFNFVDKDATHFVGEHYPAPFFDKTLRIEEAKGGLVKYLPVCTPCSRVPFKEETYVIYDAIVRGDATYGLMGEPELAKAILGFLESQEELVPWTKRNEQGVLQAQAHYRNRLGFFSPIK